MLMWISEAATAVVPASATSVTTVIPMPVEKYSGFCFDCHNVDVPDLYETIDRLRAELVEARPKWVEGPPPPGPYGMYELCWIIDGNHIHDSRTAGVRACKSAPFHMPINRPAPPEPTP